MTVEWPDEQFRAQIETVLAQRAMDADRSWYPAGHEWAILHGFPTGQSVADLIAESREVEEFRAGERSARDARLRQALADAGIAVRADGTFEGAL